MKKGIFIVSFLFTFQTQAQIVFDTAQPLDTLIQDFVGAGVTLSNVTFTGGSQSIGSFSGNSSLGSSQGIVFSSGNIDSNIAMPASLFLSTALNTSGDADLNSLVTGPTYDAAVLEFDFVASNSTLLFDYVFASEEYNEYVGSSFNDVFAFFISGPGITGKQNIALIPGSTTPVSVNNINNGPSGTGPCVNCAYFHDNTNDTTVAFDGFTTPLTATYTITPGQIYHLKLAIADVADQVFDAAVFLQKYSLRSVDLTSLPENISENITAFIYDNILHVDLADPVNSHLTIYAVDGKKIIKQAITKTNSTFDLSFLKQGIYIAVLEADGIVYHKKIIIK